MGRHPCWAFQDEPGSLLYGFPCLPGESAFRVARHRVGPTVDDPDTMSRAVSEADRAEFEPAILRLLPSAGRVSSAAIAFYSNSPDGHFILDRLPGSGIVVAGGFSGHGFKFAPVVGEVVADLVQREATAFDLSLFAVERFGEVRG
jgi:glycine/D-amino acid oxidase-like deaminating enzyme